MKQDTLDILRKDITKGLKNNKRIQRNIEERGYTYEDILPSNKLNDDTYDIVKDYITRVFTDFYNSFNSRAERFKVNKDRDINVILNICKGYTPMEVSKIMGISNQLVNSIIKKFRNYAIENNLIYSIN